MAATTYLLHYSVKIFLSDFVLRGGSLIGLTGLLHIVSDQDAVLQIICMSRSTWTEVVKVILFLISRYLSVVSAFLIGSVTVLSTQSL